MLWQKKNKPSTKANPYVTYRLLILRLKGHFVTFVLKLSKALANICAFP